MIFAVLSIAGPPPIRVDTQITSLRAAEVFG